MKHGEANWENILSDEQEIIPSTYQADKERIWNKIAAQTKPTKKIVFTPWITHVAAAVAGMLLVLSFFVFQNKPVQEVAIDKPKEKTIPVVEEEIQPITIEEVAQTKPEIEKSFPKPAPLSQPKSITQETITVDTQIIVKNIPVDNEEQPNEQHVTTFSKQTEPVKFIHLADIEKKPLANTNSSFVEKLLASKLNTPQYVPTFRPSDIIQSLSK